METGKFAELNQPGHDHLDIDVRRVMAQVHQAECFGSQLTRTIVARPPIVDYCRIKRRLVKLVLDKDKPVVRQSVVNLAHALKVALERAPEVLLAWIIPTVTDPNCMCFGAECSSDLDAFEVVLDGLPAHRFIGMRKAAEFVGEILSGLILKSVRVHRVKVQSALRGKLSQLSNVIRLVPGNVQ